MAKRINCIAFFAVFTVALFAVFSEQLTCEKQAASLDKKCDAVEKLRYEISDKGWIVYCARGDNGSWDLFLCRPDGSQQRNITNTPDFEEAGPRLNADGSKLLYRRMIRWTVIGHDKWGFQGQLMIAEADGNNPVAVGKDKEYPWASWSPDGKKIACLYPKGIEILDLATKKVVRRKETDL